MRHTLPLKVLVLLLAAGCRSAGGDSEPRGRWIAETPGATPPTAAQEEVRTVAMASTAVARKCCAGAPAPVAPEAAPAEPEDPGVLAPLGSATAIECKGLGAGVRVEVLPVEVLPAEVGGKPAVACTVRLTREGGGAIGTGSAWRRDAKDKSVDVAGIWTTGPGVAWTGNVPGGNTVYLHFEAPEGERNAPYGWYVNLSAAPAGEGRVRLQVYGSAPI